MVESTDMDTGATALTYQPPVITISGREYKLRRLGIVDTLRLAKIMAAGVAGLGTEIGNLDKMDATVLGMVLVAGAPFAEKQTLDFLGGCIGLTGADLADPERFPMGSELQIIEALIHHEDVKAFLERLWGLMRTPGLRSILRRSSISSKRDTDGQTPTSSPSPTPDSGKRPRRRPAEEEKTGVMP